MMKLCEIIKELTTKRNMSEIISEQVLMWVQRVELQRVQKKALDEMKNVRDCNHIQSGKRIETSRNTKNRIKNFRWTTL